MNRYSDSIFQPTFIKKILRENKLAPSRKLGQNFLINREIAFRILTYSKLCSSDIVLEVGPGLGTLTFLLSERVKQVIAVEFDGGYARYLSKTAEELGIQNITIINRDFLRIKEGDLTVDEAPNKVVSNFPYSIGIKAMIKIVEEYGNVETITGTVQKELAERIMASPGVKNYSAVSVYLQFLSSMKILEKNIPPANFFPSPEVTSSIIEVRPRKNETPVDKKMLKRIVKSSFTHKRKNILNNLKRDHFSEKTVQLFLNNRFNDIHIRAENLSVEQFVDLCREIEKT